LLQAALAVSEPEIRGLFVEDRSDAAMSKLAKYVDDMDAALLKIVRHQNLTTGQAMFAVTFMAGRFVGRTLALIAVSARKQSSLKGWSVEQLRKSLEELETLSETLDKMAALETALYAWAVTGVDEEEQDAPLKEPSATPTSIGD